jgi:hypothetical protein
LKVQGIVQSAPSKPFVSKLGVVEAFSVFNRFVRTQNITVADYRLFEGRFLADLQAGLFDILAVQDSHFSLAEQLIRKHGQQRECQAPDALHLAVAISIQQAGELAEFVSADRALLSIAIAENLRVNNPET